MKPGNFILDLLRTYEYRGSSARHIMTTAAMFGFNGNLIRVTLSRLVAKGTIENFERGQYRMASQSDPVNDFVEDWRLGESRRRDWQENTFVIAHTTKNTEKDTWVLEATGFIEAHNNLWVRPDNLRRSLQEFSHWLTHLGLNPDILIGAGVRFSDDDAREILGRYDITAMDEHYKKISKRIEQSEPRLSRLPRDEAMKESFTLGGEAIQVLAKDPYLPVEILAPVNRIRLWHSMQRYDELGRNIWAEQPEVMPTSMMAPAAMH